MMTQTPSGLSYEDTQVGTGASPTRGQTCVMHYTGWLWVNGAKGAKFLMSSSVDRGLSRSSSRSAWAALI